MNSKGCREDGLHKRQWFKFLANRASHTGVFQGDAVRCVTWLFSERWKRQGEFMVWTRVWEKNAKIAHFN